MGLLRQTPWLVRIRRVLENGGKYPLLAAAAAGVRTKAKLSAIPYEIQLIADEALALAAFDTPMAPTRIRLNAQTTSRLNQLFEMNLNPSHS
jgi:hypothetical protein